MPRLKNEKRIIEDGDGVKIVPCGTPGARTRLLPFFSFFFPSYFYFGDVFK